jgi:hypothetical protein
MKRLRGCQEWGVRVTRRTETVTSRAKRTDGASGTAFLAAKKQARDAAREQTVKAATVAETAFKTLSRLSRDARRREAPAEATTPPFVDAAFLVPLGRRAAFRSTARRLEAACRKAGADLTLTGPWPAYNFVQDEQERR